MANNPEGIDAKTIREAREAWNVSVDPVLKKEGASYDDDIKPVLAKWALDWALELLNAADDEKAYVDDLASRIP